MKWIITAGVLLLSMVAVSTASGAVRFNASEKALLNAAKEAGGVELQALLLNESVAGRYGRHGDKHFKDWKRQCYGVMQVQYRTAVWTIKKFKMDNQDIRYRLQYDDAFNIKVAAAYYAWLCRFFKGDKQLAILAYNVGPGNVRKHGTSFDPNNYLAKANNWIKELQSQSTDAVYYTITKGDTLSKIAKAKLGNWRLWKGILLLNKDIDIYRLKIGMRIRIK